MNLQRLFAYNTWANREFVSTEHPPKAREILSHIIGAEELWLGRIRGEAKPAIVWPKLTTDQIAEKIERLDREWKRVLADDDPARLVEYTNSKGERWRNTIDDILTHVILHGSYHRGQIAIVVRGGGETPAYTDYIHCVRQGFLSL